MMCHATGNSAVVAEPIRDALPSQRASSDLAWHAQTVELMLRAFATTTGS